MKNIELSQGKVAIVDDDMYEELASVNWYYGSNKYARRNEYEYLGKGSREKPNRKCTTIPMHRFIWELKNGKIPNGMQIDHINRNTLDNRMDNLRLATARQNKCNAKTSHYKGSKLLSDYKGVTYHKRDRRWQASIRNNGRQKYLGGFDSEIEAAKAYDKAAKKYHGKYACLNLYSII